MGDASCVTVRFDITEPHLLEAKAPHQGCLSDKSRFWDDGSKGTGLIALSCGGAGPINLLSHHSDWLVPGASYIPTLLSYPKDSNHLINEAQGVWPAKQGKTPRVREEKTVDIVSYNGDTMRRLAQLS